MDIKEALAGLDANDDELWTDEGLPRVEAVSAIMEKQVKRQEITDAWPGFNRDAAGSVPDDDPPAEDPAQESGPVEGPLHDVPEAEPAQDPEPETEPAMDLEPAKVSALSMNPFEVLKSEALTEQAMQEIEAESQSLLKQRKEIDARLKVLYERSHAFGVHLDRLRKADPNYAMRGIHAVLNRSQENRERRVKLAQKFIEAGTSAQDVRDQLSGKSKLDQAMSQGRPGWGTKRPQPRLIPQAGKA